MWHCTWLCRSPCGLRGAGPFPRPRPILQLAPGPCPWMPTLQGAGGKPRVPSRVPSCLFPHPPAFTHVLCCCRLVQIMSKSLKKLVEESREKNQPEVDMSDRGISNMLDVHGLCECRGPALPLEGLEGRVSFPSNCRPLCERLSRLIGHPLLVNITCQDLGSQSLPSECALFCLENARGGPGKEHTDCCCCCCCCVSAVVCAD